MNIYNYTRHLGCSLDESKTFEQLLPYPRGVSVVTLSKRTNKPRTTLYDHLNSLIEKGLVRKGLTEAGAIFFAEDEKSIQSIFEERSKAVNSAGNSFTKYIKSIIPETEYKSRFTIIDKPNAAEVVFRDVLRSRSEESYWFWPAKALIHTTVPDEIFDYWYTERIKRGMKVKVLWPYKQRVNLSKKTILGSGNSKESLRKIRILPGPIDATVGYGIYGNKVGYISSTRENYGYIVDSKELTESVKSQFDFFWKISKKIT